jgi:hypothetical protein
MHQSPHTADDLAKAVTVLFSSGASTKALAAALAECFAATRSQAATPPAPAAAPAPNEEQLADTVNQFCARYRIGRSSLYAQWRDGVGPRYFKVGTQKRITRQAGLDWIKAREAATAQRNTVDDEAAVVGG